MSSRSEHIENQEKQGQQEVSYGTKFPLSIRGATREQLESVGFVFGKAIDDLFQEVRLPDGWRIVPTDHSLWSNILDGTDKERGHVFYKAAFYDRDAFAQMSL